MGKRNHVVKAVHDFVQGRGFSEPFDTLVDKSRNNITVLRDIELFKVGIMNGNSKVKTEWDVVMRARGLIKSDMAQVGFGDEAAAAEPALYIALADNYAKVTTAKAAERGKRDESMRAGATDEQLEPYTDAEMDGFYLAERFGDEAALTAAELPDATRLRLTAGSTAKYNALRRFNDLLRWAMFSETYAGELGIVMVADGTAKFSKCSQEVIDLAVPDGIYEAESLAVHFAFKMLCVSSKLEFLGGGGGGEAYDAAKIGARNAKQLVVVHVADTDVFMQAMFAARIAASEHTVNAQVILDLKPNTIKSSSLPRKEPDFAYYVDVYAVFNALHQSDVHKKLGVEKSQLLVALEYIGSLGGSDKVPQVRGITADAVLAPYVRLEPPKNKPKMDVSIFRKPLFNVPFALAKFPDLDDTKPLFDRFTKPIAVRVDEDVALRYLLAAYANKYSTESATQKQVLRIVDTTAPPLDDVAVKAALSVMHADSLASLERRQKAYEKNRQKRQKEIDEWNEKALANCNLENAAEYDEYCKANKMPKPLPQPKLGFSPPQNVATVRRLVRQTTWQLTETVNAAVVNGTPLSSERTADGTMSLWGWDDKGNNDNNIVPFTK